MLRINFQNVLRQNIFNCGIYAMTLITSTVQGNKLGMLDMINTGK